MNLSGKHTRESIFFLIICLCFQLNGQSRLQAKYIGNDEQSENITIDGKLDEEIWKSAVPSNNFWQYFPTDSVKANYQTKLRVVYDDKAIYVAIEAETIGDEFVVASLRRDFRGRDTDNVSILFDTFRDGNNAFLFGTNPYGVQREAFITNGGERGGFNITWDNKWWTESQMKENSYVIEMLIPFTSLKFPSGSKIWGFQAIRFDYQSNERSAWSRVPQNQSFINLAFTGEIEFEKPLKRSVTPVAIIPYINTLSDRDFELGNSNTGLGVGVDSKVAIGTGMNLDITINPDFSTVEVDNIFTNLTRFEVQLPERRQFFIDNNDLFGSFGNRFGDASPFFSRRIGIATDTADNTIQNQILGGVRLSGKIDDNWRLGFLNIQTAEDKPNEIPSNNNMMFVMQRKIAARSNISVFALNRQTMGNYEFIENADRFNRVFGADYNLASSNNKWIGKFYVHKSLQPGDTKGNFSSQATATYNDRNYNITVDFAQVDEDFRSDLGFIRRTDVFKNGIGVGRSFYPKRGFVNIHTFRVLSIAFWRPNLDFKLTDHMIRYSYRAELKDQSNFEFNVMDQFVYLAEEFDPTRQDGSIPIPGEQGYNYNQYNIVYNSSPVNLFTYQLETTLGSFFNGTASTYSATLGLRIQPRLNLGASIRYDQIRLPEPHPNADFWLMSPTLDITFTKSIFWSTIIQYSNQRDNIGVNSRLQWRFAPLSDLYLVYNDNYVPAGFSPTYRSLNLKISYWFNVNRS